VSDATEWLYVGDVAAEFDLSRRQAQRAIKRIPGAQMLYRDERGERWRVSRAALDAWLADQKKAMS
jgi:flavin-dependent dehydrogenase